MDTNTAIILGLWAFAIATAIKEEIQPQFMLFALSLAIIGSIILA